MNYRDRKPEDVKRVLSELCFKAQSSEQLRDLIWENFGYARTQMIQDHQVGMPRFSAKISSPIPGEYITV